MCLYYSIVTFTEAYVSYVIPKTGYDNTAAAYYLTLTVCLVIPKPTSFKVTVETVLSGKTLPGIDEVMST